MNSLPLTSTGTYKVTLSIEDARGCCTTVSEQVVCDNIVKGNCKNYLCWEQFIGHIECVTSFTYILPNGTTDEITIGPFGYGNVAQQVKNAILYEVGLLGHAISIRNQDVDNVNPIDCSKAGYPDRGWFIYSDVIITGLGGNNQGNGSTCVSDEQDSYVFFNYNTSTNCQ